MTTHTLPELADAFAVWARGAGYPVLSVTAGRWIDATPVPCWIPSAPDGELTPNDLLDHARAAAYARVDWVHATLPTYVDVTRLAADIHPDTSPAATPGAVRAGDLPRQATRRQDGAWLRLLRRPGRRPGRLGDPRRIPFPALVAEIPLTVITHVTHRDGVTVHVVEIPAPWLAHCLPTRVHPEVTR